MDNFQRGETVEYIGNGFLGFDPEDNKMIYLGRVPDTRFDLEVSYRGCIMVVRNHEIQPQNTE